MGQIVEMSALDGALAAERRAGKRIVLTNGCFDLLHVGHARLLAACKEWGDVLVVGVNADESVALLKGPPRPFVPAADRAELVAALDAVDYVTVFPGGRTRHRRGPAARSEGCVVVRRPRRARAPGAGSVFHRLGRAHPSSGPPRFRTRTNDEGRRACPERNEGTQHE